MQDPSGIFAEHHLHLRSSSSTRKVIVQLGPIIRTEDAAFCRYRLLGFEQEISGDIWGLDDIQALQLALAFIGNELDRLQGDGKYSVEGDSDGEIGHGFPTLFS